MTAANLSGSAGERAAACPYSCALDAGPEEQSEDGANGTAIHAFCADVQEMDRDAALARAPDEVSDICAAIDVRAIPKGDPEVAYVWDAETDTARCLGRIPHRKYPALRPSEIPLTTDLVANVAAEVPLVWEFKTGYDNVPPAPTSMQLGLEMLAAARTLHIDTIDGAVVRIGGDGQLHPDAVTLDAFGLEDMAERWRATWRDVMAARKRLADGLPALVNPSPECRYCPAKANCPAFAGVARELLAPGNDWLARVRITIADDRGAADVWQKISVAESLLRTVRGLVEDRARAKSFELPDGSVVKEVVSRRDKVESAERALAAMQQLYGPDAAEIFDRKLHVTKGDLEKFAKSRAGNGAGAGEAKRMLAVLREHRAIVSTESRVVQAVKP